MTVKLRVPATTANLGPGFDSLGMALAIWNRLEVSPRPDQENLSISIEGFGADVLPRTPKNLVLASAAQLLDGQVYAGPGLHFHCVNGFPGSSGLGSSSAAIVMGLAGANAFLAEPLGTEALLELANRIEGHPDNVTPALLGGLTVSAVAEGCVITRRFEPAEGWHVAVAVPALAISTSSMRAALPAQVPFADAVFNLSRTGLVVRALETGDLELLQLAMQDRLHQPYRLPLIPGAHPALAAARALGLPAALSGAGPGVIAFSFDENLANEAAGRMADAFRAAGAELWTWVGKPDHSGTRFEA